MNEQNPIKVAALSGGVKTPSSRFRMRQYFPFLAKHGVEVTEHIPYFEKSCGLPSPFKAAARIPAIFRTRNADIVWLGKELVQGYMTFERLLKRPRVMDVDDAIWLSFPFGRFAAPSIARSMDALIVGNDFLAEYFDGLCKNIHIVPTAIDVDRYTLRPNINNEKTKKFVIGWTGLASNFKYLDAIEPVLNRFVTDHPDTEILIIANRPWQPENIPPEKLRFIQWSEQKEVTALHEMSVGTMPLSTNDWSRGKCSFKMLQYMAVGLPVIASPVGMNTNVLDKGNIGFAANTPDDWYQTLEQLYNNPQLQIDMGRAGRKVIEEFYNTETIAAQLANIFTSLLNS